MAPFDGLIALMVVGLMLMGVGFAARQSNWGLALLAVGTLCMLATIGYKIYLTVQ
ncbi:hypothetical protein [Alloalcanivorax gelatiniphagus]|uniref:hypothetical protein n=1 Tax=Alloalcanivorax gelatiniphagus TaxID=1194167 RepID=UPI0014774895|nr:hypothetical protein [Alloalcanivorax gelatiniphagus]|tara:strand:- start:2041 stop:2205 length:165 start_codon:yes stop_codon:yes gene_type:complete